MSLGGFMKQINKANQFMSEKIGGAKGTELEDEFIEMEKKTDVLSKAVDDLIARTQELLQPNPASRAKMASVKAISKIRGQTNTTLYPQVEGQLGECMIKYGRELGDSSLFGQALVESGESYKQLAEIKYQLEDNVKQNFIEPLHHLQNKDIKEVNHHRKKLSGRRLDYDCKRRKQQKGSSAALDEEVKQAEEKFEESKEVTTAALHNLLDNDVEQISQLASFLEAELNYYQQSMDVLQSLLESVKAKCSEAGSRPRSQYTVKRTASFQSTDSGTQDSINASGGFEIKPALSSGYQSSSSSSAGASAAGYKSTTAAGANGSGAFTQPCARALYDFEAENQGELGFKEGDIINLTSRLDDNWIEGELRGKVGFFPLTYIEVIVDLPPL